MSSRHRKGRRLRAARLRPEAARRYSTARRPPGPGVAADDLDPAEGADLYRSQTFGAPGRRRRPPE